MTRRRPGGRMTPAAQAVFRRGFEHAVRLGHRHLGCEHLLLALAESDHRAGVRLRARGLRPDLVLEQLTRAAGDAFCSDLDPGALTSIGIDLETVRERALATFGPEALSRAAAGAGTVVGARRTPRRVSGAWHNGVFLPHSPDLEELLGTAGRAGLLEPAAPFDVPDLARSLLADGGGPVPALLAAVGVDAPALRRAVAENGEPGGA